MVAKNRGTVLPVDRYKDGRIELFLGDITTLSVDAIVNAANETLLGGGGVDGAVHRAAGPELVEECRTLGGAKTGEAKITLGYDLPAAHVIHTVGPVWQGGLRGEDFLLASCYLNSLRLLVEHRLTTIAFPAISTGIYRFPIERATDIAVGTVASVIAETPSIERVIFCCHSQRDLDVYRAAAGQLL
jgi:O-acetyl-ADP-ribose deacetylase